MIKATERILRFFLTAVGMAGFCLFLLPQTAGCTPRVVISGSMEPAVPVGSIVYTNRWIKQENIKEGDNEDSNILYPIYNTEEDTDFARKLLRKTINENQDNLRVVDKFIRNWEIERISDMDKLIMATAIAELKHFPSIPVKVTLDEYIEISKSYSSPKSGGFINGILDKAVVMLKEENQIKKSGRGLMGE